MTVAEARTWLAQLLQVLQTRPRAFPASQGPTASPMVGAILDNRFVIARGGDGGPGDDGRVGLPHSFFLTCSRCVAAAFETEFLQLGIGSL